MLAQLKTPSAWATVPAGLEADGDTLSLKRTEDFFDDSALSPLFSMLTSNNGSVTEDELLLVRAPVNTDAAQVYLSGPLDPAETRKCVYRFKLLDSGQTSFPFAVQQAASMQLDLMVRIALQLHYTGELRLMYYDTSNTARYWDEAAGNWTTTVKKIADIDETALYEPAFETDGTNWSITVKDLRGSVVLAASDPVAWSSTRDDSTAYWLTNGDPFTGSGSIYMSLLSYWEAYPAGPLVATMGEVTVGAVINEIPIIESVESGAAITWRYNRDGAGFATAGTGTLTELRAALVGSHASTLDLEATFASDGDAGALIDMNGGALGGTGAVYNLSLEAVDTDAVEVVEL